MKKIFVVKKHEDHGTLGVIDKDAPNGFEPLMGMACAHDCLEHFPNDDGSIDNEFKALGCTAYLRGSTGYFQNHGVEKNIASDFINLWYHYRDNVKMLPPRSKIPINYLIRSIINEVKYTLPKEQLDGYNNTTCRPFIKSAEYWMQKGFNLSKLRYPNPARTIIVFQEIEHKVDEILKYAEEGDNIIIQFTQKKVIRITHKSLYDMMAEVDYYN